MKSEANDTFNHIYHICTVF